MLDYTSAITEKLKNLIPQLPKITIELIFLIP